MDFATLFPLLTVAFFGSLALTLFVVKLWSDAAPKDKPAAVVTPAKRPEETAADLHKAA